MITHLEIENFKGISKLKIDDLKQFNIIIGKNDASKSTILESIFAFHATLIDPVNNFPTITRNRFGKQHAREIWHNYSTTVTPLIKIKLDGLDCHLTFSSDFDFNFVNVNMEIAGKGDIGWKMSALLDKVTEQKNPKFIGSLEGHLQEYFNKMIFFDEMHRMKIRVWEQKILTESLEAVDVYDDSIKSLSPVDYTGGEKRLIAGEGSFAKFLDGYGEGRKSGLSLLTIANSLKNTVLLIEEIETHQHPEAIRKLIKKLIEICKENNNQVFVTTHSPEVLQLFATSKDTKFIHVSKPKMDEIIVSNIVPNDIRMFRDLGWNLGNILSYEKYVLVEGELEKVVLEHSFYKLKNYWPEEVGITIVVYYGIRKIKEILKSISIPEKSIFVQRDLDNNSKSTIETEIVNGFCELTGEGYTRTDDGTKIILTKNSTVKQLDQSKIITTGLPSHFTQISNHATDDYLLYMLEQNPSILNTINATQNTLPTLQDNTSKEILSRVCGRYDSIRAMEILANADVSIFPTELKDIIDKIESS